MSTKELYTALLTARTDKSHDSIHNMDEAIRKFITAERALNFLNQYHGSDDLLRRRLKANDFLRLLGAALLDPLTEQQVSRRK
jgi:hypothetical protein